MRFLSASAAAATATLSNGSFPVAKSNSVNPPSKLSSANCLKSCRLTPPSVSELARYEHDYPSGSRVHLLFFAVTAFSGEPKARVFEQISWVPLAQLPAVDFLEGDLDFVKRLARGDYRRQLAV